MEDPLVPYEYGLKFLLLHVDKNTSDYRIALSQEARLVENIRYTRSFGDSEAQRAERMEIIDQLNTLAQNVLQRSFTELSMLGDTSVLPSSEAKQFDDFLKPVRNYIVVVQNAVYETSDVFSVGNEIEIWPPACERIINTFRQCGRPTLPDMPLLDILEVKLSYIEELIEILVQLIGEFSPNGRKLTKQATQQRNEIRNNFKILIQSLESIIALISSISNTLVINEQEDV